MRLLSLKEVQNLLLEVMVTVDTFCRQHSINYYMIGGTILGAVRHKGFIPWDDDIDIGMLREDYERFLVLAKDYQWEYELKNYRSAKNCDYVITRLFIPNTYIDNPALSKTKIDKRLYFDIFPLDYASGDLKHQMKQSKRLVKLKKTVAYIDVKANSKNSKTEIFIKKVLSFILSPFRQIVLSTLENTMSKYKTGNYVCSMASQYSYERQTFKKSVYGEPKEYEFEGHSFMGPDKSHEYLSQLYGNDYLELPPVEKRRKGCDIYMKEV